MFLLTPAPCFPLPLSLLLSASRAGTVSSRITESKLRTVSSQNQRDPSQSLLGILLSFIHSDFPYFQSADWIPGTVLSWEQNGHNSLLSSDSLCSGGKKVKVKSLSRVQLFGTAWTVAYQAPLSIRFPSPGVDCHFLLQGIFPTQGSNPGLPRCRQTLYHLSHQGSLSLY